MHEPLREYRPENPKFFPAQLADESNGQRIDFFKSIQKDNCEVVKVFFTNSKIFMITLRDNVQVDFTVRIRAPQSSLIAGVYQ